MKVKKLIEILKSMPQEANVMIDLRQSENMIDIDKVRTYKYVVAGNKEIHNVDLVANWIDFKLDEKENANCDIDREKTEKNEQFDPMDKVDQWYDEQQDRLAEENLGR